MLCDIGDKGFINVLHNPVEELGVDMFGQRVTGVGGLQAWEGLDIGLCGRLQLPVAQPLRHVLVGHAYQLAECRQVPIVGLRQEEEIFIITKRNQTRCQLRDDVFSHLDFFKKLLKFLNYDIFGSCVQRKDALYLSSEYGDMGKVNECIM